MQDHFSPRFVRLAQLFAAIGVFALLVLSVLTIGKLAFGFGVEAIGLIASHGVVDGIAEVTNAILKKAVLDYGDGFEIGSSLESLRSTIAMISGAFALISVLFLYPAIWVKMAQLSLHWFRIGIWSLRKEPEPDNVPGDLEDPDSLWEKFDNPNVVGRQSRPDTAIVFGENERYMPDLYRKQFETYSRPVRAALSALGPIVFWILLTGACVVGLFLIVTPDRGLVLPEIGSLFGEITQKYWQMSRLWIVFAFLAACGLVWMNWRFARALVPPKPPSAEVHNASERGLAANMPPSQFDSVFRGELKLKDSQAIYTSKGSDNTKRAFSDQSNFYINLIVEGESLQEEPYAAQTARRRILLATGMKLAGVAILLFGLIPANLLSIFQGDYFKLSDALVSPLWVATVLMVGRFLLNNGRDSFAQASAILKTAWFKTPVVLVRLDGTVNTQTATTGKSISDSTGTEMHVQQSVFDAFISSATLECCAGSPEQSRRIWSYCPDTTSGALCQNVTDLLRSEGSKSIIQAAQRTISDTESVRDATELRRAELQLQLKKTEIELENLGQAPRIERDDT